MGRKIVVMSSVLALVTGVAAEAWGQWGKLVPDVLKNATGIGAVTTKSPAANVLIATIAFIEGGQKLAESVNDAKKAAQYGATIDNLKKDGLSKESLGKVDEIASDMNKIADDKEAMKKSDSKKVTDATVKVGVASYFEAQGVNAARSAAANMNVGNVNEMALVGLMAPKNLQSMLSVQTTLLKYLKVKGIDPSPSVQSEIAKLEKA